MASEKTLPMAVTVIASLPESLGSKGELTVPCVLVQQNVGNAEAAPSLLHLCLA